MGIIIKQSFWNSIWSYLGIALGYVNLVLLFPKFLEPDEFGLTRVFIAASTIIGQVGTLGLINITEKYFPYFKTQDNRHNGFLFFGYMVTTIGALLCVLGLIFFKPLIVKAYISRSQLVIDYYYWLIPLSIALIYFHQYASYARVILKSSIQTFARDLMIRALHFGCIVLYAFNWVDFETFIALFVLSYFVNGVFLLLYLLIDKALHFIPNMKFYQSLPLKEIAKYGGFVIFSTLGGYVAGSIDILMIGSLSENGLADVAIYSVAFYIGTIVNIPIKSVYSIAAPIVSQAWKDKDMAKIESIYKKSSINQLVIGCLIFLGLWANIDVLFAILPEEYSSGRWVVLIIAAAQMMNVVAGISNGIIVNAPYYRYDSFFIVIMISMNVGLNIVFIKSYGFIGAAYATAITLGFYNFGRIATVFFKSGIHPFTRKTLYVMLISIAIYLLQAQIPAFDMIFLDLALRSILIVLLFVPAVYFFKISEEINDIILRLWDKW